MAIERDHLYVIAPGTYLAVKQGHFDVSKPGAGQGARLPFDFLLSSLAQTLGDRAVCVVLSGTGADGSVGLKAVHENGGLIIVQKPDEADYDGMPLSALATGLVDHVLTVAEIPGILNKAPGSQASGVLADIIALLGKTTKHDFASYKPGTLQRRIERRMALNAIALGQMETYHRLLKANTAEIDLLAKDLFIHVTSFFRDPKVFDYLADKVIPDIEKQNRDKSIRLWIAGCSTGEEAYSLAILFQEQIARAKSNTRLQIFASDVDAESMAFAREGVYPDAIRDDMTPERLSQFFSKGPHGYRVSAALRAAVIFTEHDILSDPPFSRLDLISCRNVLIYLAPEAQAKVISMFHFALRNNAVLVLGNAETVHHAEGRFLAVAKTERIYRHVGRSRPEELTLPANVGDTGRFVSKAGTALPPTRLSVLAELCRRQVIEQFAPAAVLIDAKNDSIYTMGPTERYLSVAAGHATLDILAMAKQGLRLKLKSVISQVKKDNARVVAPGGQTRHDGKAVAFQIDAKPLRSDGEDFTLICFVEQPGSHSKESRTTAPHTTTHVAQLEHELATTQDELQEAVRNLEVANEDQRVINEEASSVNEEFQSTNEELLTSKEELQSLNEELNALNAQLHETLDRQRSTADDLQNILYSTNVATLFLDRNLKIRFFHAGHKGHFQRHPHGCGPPTV